MLVEGTVRWGYLGSVFHMKKLAALLLFGSLALGQTSDTVNKTLFSDIKKMMAGLSQITGLKAVEKLKYHVIDKAQLRAFLVRRIKEVYKPEDLRIEELTLKVFGFVPQDFDLEKATVDLLTEQAAAFYDYRKKELFVLNTTGGEMQKMALVHELAHALADQHFHLEKFVKETGAADDAATARLAVMEGQASWLMLAYSAMQMGQSADVPDAVFQMMTASMETSINQFPIFGKSPLYLRESLVFPYTRGMHFQNAVYKKLGKKAFAEVFLHPPLSTQQIIHPEAYLDHLAPSLPEPVEVPDARAYRKLAEGSLGEFDHSVLIEQYADKAQAETMARHWKGSVYRLLEHKSEHYPVLAYASEWDSPEAARTYFGLYRRVLEGKWKKVAISKATPDSLAGSGDGRYFLTRVEGIRVTSIEGLAASVAVN